MGSLSGGTSSPENVAPFLSGASDGSGDRTGYLLWIEARNRQNRVSDIFAGEHAPLSELSDLNGV